jgi:hypothetical protein
VQQRASPAASWDYKYPYTPCPGSMCREEDTFCRQVEALVQCVLRFPRLPPRTARMLPDLPGGGSIDQITDTVERMADAFGQEITLYFIRKDPLLLSVSFEEMLARKQVTCTRQLCMLCGVPQLPAAHQHDTPPSPALCIHIIWPVRASSNHARCCAFPFSQAVQSLLDLRTNEVPMLLRKNPHLLVRGRCLRGLRVLASRTRLSVCPHKMHARNRNERHACAS